MPAAPRNAKASAVQQLPLYPDWLTNEVRAELVASTGHDLDADDPLIILVKLNEIAMRKQAIEVLEIWKAGATSVTETLQKMRKDTLEQGAKDFLALRGQAVDSMKLDFALAEGRAVKIVAGIETGIRMHRIFWVVVGFVACGLVWLGFLLGQGALPKTKSAPHLILPSAGYTRARNDP
jgi:hypothetical protein